MADSLRRSANDAITGVAPPAAVEAYAKQPKKEMETDSSTAEPVKTAAAPSILGKTQGYSAFQDDDDPEETVAPGATTVTPGIVAEDHSPHSQNQPWTAFCAFVLFGVGSGWLVVNSAFLQLPFYQHKFGLAASNRMEMGYNMGTLSVPCFALVRALLQRHGRRVYYKWVITAIAILNFASLLAAADGINTIEELVLLNFVGGSCGYLTGFVHQSYILVRYESRYVAAFWTGDAAGGALAAVLALLQRPDRGDASNFSSAVFYLLMAPLVPLSLFMLWNIERLNLGRLKAVTSERALQGADVDGEDEEPEIVDDIELVDSQVLDGPLERHDKSSKKPVQRVARLAKKVSKKVSKSAGIALAGLRTRPKDSMVLAVVVFWTQFANWGVGDSIYPYACDNASEHREQAQDPSNSVSNAETCVFNASFATVFAELIGSYMAAALVGSPSLATLLLPILVYSGVFFLLCVATVAGGSWASPFGLGAWYVVLLVAVMRISGPFLRNIVNVLIQVLYEPLVWDDVNFVLLCLGTFSNVVGMLAGIAFVG